jgi:hypothetical protein
MSITTLGGVPVAAHNSGSMVKNFRGSSASHRLNVFRVLPNHSSAIWISPQCARKNERNVKMGDFGWVLDRSPIGREFC